MERFIGTKNPIQSLFGCADPIKPVDSNATPRRKCKTIKVGGKELTVEVKR